MQLLDSHQASISTVISSPGLQHDLHWALSNIAAQVQLQDTFSIHHPDYKPLEIPEQGVERLQQLPPDLQQKFRKQQLCSFLYGIYYNGSLHKALAPDSDKPALSQNFENNTFLGVDLAFYDRLHEANAGKGYFDPGWQVLREEEDGTVAVTKNSLTVHIERERHLQSAEQAATVGDVVAIHLPKNRVQNGFYMAISNVHASHPQVDPDLETVTVRVYFNLSPDGAVAVMGRLTQQLNAIPIPFSFKALYNPSDYGRYDAAVLYFEKRNYPVVRSVLQQVYAEQRTCFQSPVPLFTKAIAPGLAIAEEPDFKFSEQESFGMNRCQIVANALLEAWQQGHESVEARMDAILHHFSVLNIDLQRPYLNADSEDVYEALDV